MINRKKSCAANHRVPTAPFPIQGSKKQPTKEIFFSEWGERYGHDSKGDSQIWYFRHLLLRFAVQARHPLWVLKRVFEGKHVPQKCPSKTAESR